MIARKFTHSLRHGLVCGIIKSYHVDKQNNQVVCYTDNYCYGVYSRGYFRRIRSDIDKPLVLIVK